MLSRIVSVMLVCLMVAGVFSTSAAENQKVSRVMVLPVDGTAAGEFQYLTDSIRTMLATRLAAKPGVEVVEYSLSAADIQALQAGDGLTAAGASVFARLKTDYLVSSTLYALQTGLKIQVTLSRKTDGAEVREGVFTVLAENEDRIISAVEELADDIAGRGLGARTGESLIAETQGQDKKAIAGFGTEHPEKLFKKGLYSGAIVAEGTMQVESLGVRRSSDLPLTLVSMAAGDLDGDGTVEIVAASRSSLEVYRFDATLFTKLGEYSFDDSYKIHAVNIADQDGDGTQEIYVSANNDIPASSAIFTWSATAGLTPKMTNIPYYIRPVEVPSEGLILAGQKGTPDFGSGFVAKKIVKLVYSPDRSQLVEEKTIPLPANVDLFDFIYAELDGTGGKELVTIDRNEKMLVYDADNNLLWVSEKDYGGSRNYIGPPKSSAAKGLELLGGNRNARMKRPLVYVPLRLLAVDLDQDGKEEILVGGNKRVTPKLLINFREYDGGAVTCLSWQNNLMAELWRTNTVAGYLADYTFMMVEKGPEADTLYIAQVPDKQLFGFSFAGDSKLLKYRMNVVGK